MINSIFTTLPREFYIPAFVDMIYVSDFFVTELTGGAELTFEAIIEASPFDRQTSFRVHSSSVTIPMLKRAPKKALWVLGNFSQMEPEVIQWMSDPSNNISYVVLEMDFKFCNFRSPLLHETQMKSPCDCHLLERGILVANFFKHAKLCVWMSTLQKKKYQDLYPSVLQSELFESISFVSSSIFAKKSIEILESLIERRKNGTVVKNQYAVLGSSSWIKGTKEATEWCTANKKTAKVLSGLSPAAFLEELAKCEGFVFLPKDDDTCPRVTIEAKILGLDLVLNNHVLQRIEPWFETPETALAYMKKAPAEFWRRVHETV
jgi:hypothetical protein